MRVYFKACSSRDHVWVSGALWLSVNMPPGCMPPPARAHLCAWGCCAAGWPCTHVICRTHRTHKPYPANVQTPPPHTHTRTSPLRNTSTCCRRSKHIRRPEAVCRGRGASHAQAYMGHWLVSVPIATSVCVYTSACGMEWPDLVIGRRGIGAFTAATTVWVPAAGAAAAPAGCRPRCWHLPVVMYGGGRCDGPQRGIGKPSAPPGWEVGRAAWAWEQLT